MNRIKLALLHLQQGGMVVVVDDENRENEGDLICPASTVTKEQVNFMSQYGRGLICLALPPQQIRRLDLPLMRRNAGPQEQFGTAFTYSIDASSGITTGISAADRALTMRLATDAATTAEQLSVPGHVFPLEAKAGGVLERRGHTEAAVDLTRLAGLTAGGVICEIMAEDGNMMRLPALREFAERHGMPLLSIKDLVEYRLEQEMQNVCQIKLPTPAAEFHQRIYHDSFGKEHVLLWLGDKASFGSCATPPLVRIHSECLTGDVFQSLRCDCGLQLRQSMELMANEGCGVLMYLRQEGRGIGLTEKIKAYALQDNGLDTVEANHALGHAADLRSYEVPLKMLGDLNINRIRLLTNNPKKSEYLKLHGIEVERVPLLTAPTPHNAHYQQTKAIKLGHIIPQYH